MTSVVDVLRAKPYPLDSFSTSTGLSHSFVFTLDDIKVKRIGGQATGHYQYVSGSRADGSSVTAKTGSMAIIDQEINNFTMPLYGGFDGLDITERDPFRNTLLGAASSEPDSSELYSVKRAIRSVSDPEVAEYDLIAAPGITDAKITDQLLSVAEQRGDA